MSCREDRYRQSKSQKEKSTITLRSSGLLYQSLGASHSHSFKLHLLFYSTKKPLLSGWLQTYKYYAEISHHCEVEGVRDSNPICEPMAQGLPHYRYAILPFGASPPRINVCVLFMLRASQRWFGSGRRTRTSGLQDMSLTSYQLLYPALVKETSPFLRY